MDKTRLYFISLDGIHWHCGPEKDVFKFLADTQIDIANIDMKPTDISFNLRANAQDVWDFKYVDTLNIKFTAKNKSYYNWLTKSAVLTVNGGFGHQCDAYETCIVDHMLRTDYGLWKYLKHKIRNWFGRKNK